MNDATVTKKLMFYFPKCECDKPIIYHLVKDHHLVVNVFRAKVTPEEEGYLVLDVTGTEKEIQGGIDFVKTFNVIVNYSGKGVIRDEERCTHCGYFTVASFIGALKIENDATRKIAYDESQCIECLACIRVCPFAACTSAF
ncbi:MAG: 4Fe-4S binding protein [Deltaproteobacteria bacterium]|nr:4Fe-4S binding protein [Deltaproteobacteria bacterium]